MLEFNEQEHLYTYNGKPLPGVTSILSVIAKPALIGWAAKEAVNYVNSHWAPDVAYDDSYIKKVLAEAKVAHAKKKTDAGSFGTEVHKAIEEWIKEKKAPTFTYPEAKKSFDNFLAWVETDKVVFIESEKRVCSPTYWYAGTLDFIATVNGTPFIGDIKTSSGIYGREYFLQCAAYRVALEESNYPYNFAGSVVVRVGKKGDFETKYSYDYDGDRRGFLAALELYKVQKAYEINPHKDLKKIGRPKREPVQN